MSKWSEENIEKIVQIMRNGGTIRQILDALKPAYIADRFGFYEMEVGEDYFFPDENPKIIREATYERNKKYKHRHYRANLVNGVIRVRRDK